MTEPVNQMTDGALLAAFSATGNQTAFAEIVQRHGAMVHGVCLRGLGDHHEAEDAAQAVFVTLARKAASLRKDSSVGGWLHTVARRLAKDIRRSRAARQRREEMVMSDAAVTNNEGLDPRLFRESLDDALGDLPDRYRRPLVLFHLEGRSLQQTAAQLGLTASATGVRLSRARELLRKKLVRRGVTVGSVGALTALLSAESGAAVLPATFVASTVSAATGGAVSTTVAALSKGALHMLFIAKVKTVSLAAAACLVVVGSGVVVANQLAASTPSTTVVAAGPVTTPPRTLAGSPAGSLGAQSTPAKPVEPVQTTVPAIGIQRATSSGPSLAQLIQRADWIVAGTVTAHVKGAGDKPKPAAFKIKVDETVLQPKALLPAEIEVKPYIPLNLRRASLYAQPPIGSLNGDIPNTWQEPPAIGALVVVFGSATGCNWAEFANATDREAFVQRLRGYLDGSIHKQLAVELLQPAPADVPTDYTKPHPAIALCDLEVLGHSGDGPAIIRYAKQFEQEQQVKMAGKDVPFFDLDRANQIVSTLVAVGERGDDAARQFAAELVTRGQQFASNGAEGTLWASLGRWGWTDVAPQAIEIFRKNPWRTASGTDFSRGYFPALKQAAPEQYNKVRTQVTDPTLGQLLDALVADTKQ